MVSSRTITEKSRVTRKALKCYRVRRTI